VAATNIVVRCTNVFYCIMLLRKWLQHNKNYQINVWLHRCSAPTAL
jgi:hypothetical protein